MHTYLYKLVDYVYKLTTNYDDKSKDNYLYN